MLPIEGFKPKMRAQHAVRMEDMKNTYRILLWKPGEKRHFLGFMICSSSSSSFSSILISSSFSSSQ
jgi:hypothetical protein